MGLDVYLYKKLDDYDLYHNLEEEYEIKAEENWNASGKKYEALTQQEKDEIRKKNENLASEMGLKKWGEHPKGHMEEEIRTPSQKYPDHLFQIGYFRSSYNNRGFNHITRNLFGKDLYWIFEPNDQNYLIQVDWKKARERCIHFLEEFKKKVEEFPFQCTRVSHHCEQINEEKALEIFKEERERSLRQQNLWDYSNSRGLFVIKNPITVHAVIQGKGYFGPETYLIHEGNYEHYIQSTEIVLETIDYVLRQTDPENYFFHWSS